MKQRFWLFKRGPIFYLEDSETGKKEGLNTSDPKRADRLRVARNEAVEKPLLGLTLAKACLSAADPALTKRTWRLLMEQFCEQKIIPLGTTQAPGSVAASTHIS